jgi:hypothetical protein
MKLRNVSFKSPKHPCFLYNVDALGITLEELQEAFEGMYMDVYEYVPLRKLMGGQKITTKCPWCGESFDNLVKHIWKEHKKKRDDLLIVKLQNELYKQQLRIVKSNKRNYFAHAVLFGSTCQYCVKPRIPGREGKCALPESARNKMRSLNVLGFSCDGFDSLQLSEKLMGGVIYAEKKDELEEAGKRKRLR